MPHWSKYDCIHLCNVYIPVIWLSSLFCFIFVVCFSRAAVPHRSVYAREGETGQGSQHFYRTHTHTFTEHFSYWETKRSKPNRIIYSIKVEHFFRTVFVHTMEGAVTKMYTSNHNQPTKIQQTYSRSEWKHCQQCCIHFAMWKKMPLNFPDQSSKCLDQSKLVESFWSSCGVPSYWTHRCLAHSSQISRRAFEIGRGIRRLNVILPAIFFCDSWNWYFLSLEILFIKESHTSKTNMVLNRTIDTCVI